MAIEKFIVGHYYKFVGDKSFHRNWNEHMDKWKDGVPRKCTKISEGGGRVYQECEFENIGGGIYWCYRRTSGHFDLFEEVNADGSTITLGVIGSDIPNEDDTRKRVLGYL